MRSMRTRLQQVSSVANIGGRCMARALTILIGALLWLPNCRRAEETVRWKTLDTGDHWTGESSQTQCIQNVDARRSTIERTVKHGKSVDPRPLTNGRFDPRRFDPRVSSPALPGNREVRLSVCPALVQLRGPACHPTPLACTFTLLTFSQVLDFVGAGFVTNDGRRLSHRLSTLYESSWNHGSQRQSN